MQKIYFQEKPLFLASEISPQLEALLHQEDTIFMDDFDQHAIKTMIHEMQAEQINRGVFLHADQEALLNAFKKKFTVVKAGGGVVRTEANELLMIFRRGKWDLPKGKLDEGETIEACALREVSEETGITGIIPGPFFCHTYHTYHENGKFILKESHWYLMKLNDKPELVPQAEEGILEARWVSFSEIENYLDKVHSSIKDVLEKLLEESK